MPCTSKGLSGVLGTVLSLCLLALAGPGVAEMQRAVIFMDPDVTPHERRFQDARVRDERAYYEARGYVVEVQDAPTKAALTDKILAALMASEVKAVSFFGHGYGPDAKGATSTLLFENAHFWRDLLYRAHRKALAAQGETGVDANRKARRLGQNAQLEIMRNHSCSSLRDTRMAEALVAPGGSYFGVKGLYSTCVTPAALFWEIDWNLTEYVMPKASPAPPTSSPPAATNTVTGPGGVCTPEGFPGPVHDCRIQRSEQPCLPCPNGFDFYYEPNRYE